MKQLLVLKSSSVIIGTVVGAGILGLPFAFVQAGFGTGLTVLIIISACVAVLSLLLGEIMLRTRETHQLAGYTEIYLGKTAKHFQAGLMLFGMYSALLAYTIGQGEIISNMLGGSPVLWSILGYVILAALVSRGLGIIKEAEFIIAIIVFGLIFILGILATPHLQFQHLNGFDWKSLFVPYGAILFACSGLASIPEAKEVLGKGNEKLLRPAILIGHVVPMIVYILFTAIVVGVTGAETTEVATIGLSAKIGFVTLAIGSLFGIIAMSSSFMTLGTAIKEIYQYDYGVRAKIALILTLIVPFALFLSGFRNFFGIVSTAGALGVGLSGLLTVAMYWRARRLGERKPEFSLPLWFAVPASVIIAAMFIGGLIYTL